MNRASQRDHESDQTGGRAAAYVRMSTEHQQYSVDNQLQTIELFAEAHGLEIVRTYADEGKSGLTLAGRDALRRLLSDIELGAADFSTVLVYDVSRWGRFQDPDEGASYEIRCKHAGVTVQYCAEQFANDGSPISCIVRNIKRTMSGEYSRELSVKVFAGQARQIGLGHRQGGIAGYGLRRLLIDHTGASKGILGHGDRKSLQTDRVILVPGPPEEVEVVRFIYREFIEEGRPEREIAALLNTRGLMTDLGRPWTRGTVHQILINEKYIGHNVWNRCSFKLKERRVRNPPEVWIRAANVFQPIVDTSQFEDARAIILSRSCRLSDDEMLDALRTVMAQRGALSGLIIDEADGCPSSSAFRSRFGSLLRTYALIGYLPQRDYHYIEVNRRLRALHPKLVDETIDQVRALGGRVEIDRESNLLTVNEEFTVSVVLSRCRHTPAGSRRWVIRLDSGLYPDITVAVRMKPEADDVFDYYLLPTHEFELSRVRLGDCNGTEFDAYRFDRLDALFDLARRVPFREVPNAFEQ